MNNLNGKIALVTGGNSGIGYAAAKALAANGAQVIITGRREAAVKQAAEELGATGLIADQGIVADIDKLSQDVKAQFGKIDILFINAGVASFSSIADATEEGFDDMMDINFKGAYFTLSRFIPLLKEGASVIFLSSNVSDMHSPNFSVYCASKAALSSIMKTAAAELAPLQIRVNAVSPGPTKTAIFEKTGLPEDVVAGMHETLATKVPLGRIIEPEEVAGLVVYLAGEQAASITGSEFTIDGGFRLVNR